MSYILDGVTYYTVRFLNYDGDDLLAKVDVPEGGDATPLAPEPEQFDHMVFIGWNRDITHIVNDKTVRPLYHNIYTVVFMNFADTEPLSTQDVEQTKDAVPPEPETIKGHTFLRWDTDYTNVQSDLTVRPIYEVTGFEVRFLNHDKTDVVSVQYVEKGEDAVPPTPERVGGEIFIGWSSSFRKVDSDRTIYPVYREIPPNPALNFYDTNADGTSGELLISYSAVNACSIVQKLSGECTIDVKLLTRRSEGHVDVNSRLEVDGLVFYITAIKKSISNGICYTQFSGEHISYILLNDAYKVTAVDKTGTVKEILEMLLAETPFTVGAVDIDKTVTLRINKECTRRAAIMQLVALAGGEIEYYGYTIGIRTHIGNSTPLDIMKRASVQDISFSHSVPDGVTNYELSLYKKGDLELGDELTLQFKPLAIQSDSRIVGMDWNPFNYKEVKITVGAYIPELNDSLYEVIGSVEDIQEETARYTLEFGEMIGNGSFYFTRAYFDRPYFHIHTDDGSVGTVTLNRRGGREVGSYIGATLSGVSSTTTTLLVFYCTVPDQNEEVSS